MEKSNNLLITLHSDILRMILSDWVDVVDLVSLDGAYCSTSTRPLFLDVLSTMSVRRCRIVWRSYQNLLAWILSRGIYLTDLTISSSLDVMIYEQLLKRRGNRIEVISTIWEDEVPMNTNILHLIPLYCKNLVEMFCYSFLDLRSISDVLRECTVLSKLYLTAAERDRLDVQDIDSEIVQCKNLSSVGFKGINMDDPVAHYILQSASNVRSLTVHANKAPKFQISSLKKLQRLGLRHSSIGDEALVVITKSCMQIEHLNLSDCGNLTVAGIVEAVCCLQTLRSLGMEKNYYKSETLREIINCHSSSLEALYLPRHVEASELEFIIRRCFRLHTISFDIWRVNFELLDIDAFRNIAKLILSGDTEEGAEQGIFKPLVRFAPHCQKLEYLGLRLIGRYSANKCAGLYAMIQHCSRLHTLQFVESGWEDEIGGLDAITCASWRALRPNLEISCSGDYDEGKHPLVYDIDDA